MSITKPEICIKVPVKIFNEQQFFTVECPVFNLFASANSKSLALKELKGSIDSFLELCYKEGNLDEVLFNSVSSHAGEFEYLYVSAPMFVLRHLNLMLHVTPTNITQSRFTKKQPKNLSQRSSNIH